MQYKQLLVVLLLLMCGNTTNLFAQNAFTSAGGTANGTTGSVTYSVGQMAYTVALGPEHEVTAGVQQPYEISVVNGSEKANGITLSVLVYPNPTTDYLTLSIDKFDLFELSYQLYDMQGKLLQNQKITSNKTSIAMSNLVPATYFVKVSAGKNEVKTFKILKK